MCYFISIALPESMAASHLSTLPTHVYAEPVEKTILTRELPSGYQTYYLITRMCSCDLFCAVRPDDEERRLESLRKKYRKKGWSKAKIERALSDHQTAIAKSQGLRDDIRKWILQVVNQHKEVLFLLVHMYSGAVVTAKFSVASVDIKQHDFSEFSRTFPEDTLVMIRP